MNKRRAVNKSLSEWQAVLEISEWVVQTRLYQRLKQDGEAIDWRYSEKTARMNLNGSESIDKLEYALAHELSHLLHAPENRVFDNLLETKLLKRERKAWEEQFNLAQNESIEHYLRIIYSLLGKIYPPHKGD